VNTKSAALKLNLVSVDDFLAGELVSPIRHEYLGGVVYAMAGARNAHSRIKMNISGALYVRLRGKRCQVWNSVMLRKRQALLLGSAGVLALAIVWVTASSGAQDAAVPGKAQANPLPIRQVVLTGTIVGMEAQRQS
jgi:hypothetical protein